MLVPRATWAARLGLSRARPAPTLRAVANSWTTVRLYSSAELKVTASKPPVRPFKTLESSPCDLGNGLGFLELAVNPDSDSFQGGRARSACGLRAFPLLPV